MVKKRYPRDRRGRSRKRGAMAAATSEHRVHHPRYGEIPLIRESVEGQDGRMHEWWRYDPDYSPPLPRGAVRGDARRQVYCRSHHIPKYFFVDEERACVQCGSSFVFRAAEQKHWYETLKFNFSSVPIRCLGCRRQRRSEHALREQIARAKAEVRASATDPASHLSLARAIVEHHERTNNGNLAEAISEARRAAALWVDSPEPLLWEGIAQARSGRREKARQCLETFLSQGRHPSAALVQRARQYLEQA